MAQYVPLPDGSYVTVREGETPLTAFQRAQKEYPEAFQAKEEPKTGIGAAFGKGLESLLSSGRTAFGAVSDAEEAARAARARQEDIQKKYADQVSWEKVKQAYEKQGILSAAGEALSQIPAAIAEQAPQQIGRAHV